MNAGERAEEVAHHTDPFERMLDHAEAERDRYKAALERIAQEPAPGSTIACRRIAREALDGCITALEDREDVRTIIADDPVLIGPEDSMLSWLYPPNAIERWLMKRGWL